MPRQNHSGLTMRERQIMDVLYRNGEATVGDVMNSLPDRPTYSTVRTQLRVLEQKGHIRHFERDLRYVYEPVISRNDVKHSALAHVVDTFFEGSMRNVIASLLGREKKRMTDQELARIVEMIEHARKGRK